MSIYRRHSSGIWTTQSRLSRLKKEIKMFEIIGSFYDLKRILFFVKLSLLDILNYLLQKSNKQFSKQITMHIKAFIIGCIKNLEALKSILLFYFWYT